MSRKEIINQLVDEKFPIFADVSDKVWDYAELCFREYKSSELQKKVLREQGFTINENIKGIPTAFIAEYGQGHPIIAILGEYDALANLDQVADSLEKESQKPGHPGHGCGHNLLGAASMSAVTAVKDYMEQNQISGTIRYYGCPAEEGGSAKTFMCRDGYFDDCDIELSWHPAMFNYACDGSDVLGISSLIFDFEGIASHAAASPHLGRSALDAVELMNVGVNYMREHVTSDARIHYAYLNAGGTAANVVQPNASVSYIVRALDMANVYSMVERIVKIAEGAALMTETKMSYRMVSGTSTLIATPIVRETYDKNIKEFLPVPFTEEELEYAKKFREGLGGGDDKRTMDCIKAQYPEKSAEEIKEMFDMPMANYFCMERGGGASTDAGDVSWVVPGCQLHIACYPIGLPWHSWQLTSMGKSPLVKRGTATAAKVLAATALDFMTNPEMVAQAKIDHLNARDGQPYRCPLPADLEPNIEGWEQFED